MPNTVSFDVPTFVRKTGCGRFCVAILRNKNLANMRRLTDDMELHFFEIPKFRKKPIAEMTRAERGLAYFASQLDEQEAEEMEATKIYPSKWTRQDEGIHNYTVG